MQQPQRPLLFLLVRFSDDGALEPISLGEAQVLFTQAGRGRNFLVDYFHDVAHGMDMSGNHVVGWLDVGITHARHDELRAANRAHLINLAESVARAHSVAVDQFVATVVVTASTNGADFYGGFSNGRGYAQTVADPGGVSPSALCQEIVHALGIPQHSRRQGSDQDYRDPFDVMSRFTMGYTAPHPENGNYVMGPGINAAFLDRCGWLDTTRGVDIRKSGSYALRPLHRRDLPGNLYATLGGTYIEYRPKAGWDAGFPESVVLTHYRQQHTSYLAEVLTGNEPRPEPSPFQIFGGEPWMWVSSIDDDAEQATIEIHVPREAPTAGPATLFGGVAQDGGGWVVVGGQIVRIPPRSPLLTLLEQVAGLQQLEDIPLPPTLQLQASQELLASLATNISTQLDETRVSRHDASATHEQLE